MFITYEKENHLILDLVRLLQRGRECLSGWTSLSRQKISSNLLNRREDERSSQPGKNTEFCS